MIKYLSVLFILTYAQISFAQEIDDNFNSELKPIFENLLAKKIDGIVNKEYTIEMNIEIAAGDFITFSDAYVITSQTEKYQFGKWSVSEELVKPLEKEKKVKVTFVVEKVEIEVPYKNMPHIVAKITKLEKINN